MVKGVKLEGGKVIVFCEAELTEDEKNYIRIINDIGCVEFRCGEETTRCKRKLNNRICYGLLEKGLLLPIEEAWHESYEISDLGKKVVNLL